MAKLIKYFGIGGKKNPPHPPKPDYNNTKSTSVQDLTGRFHTTDRTCRSSLIHTSGSHFATFDTRARSNSDRASPRHYRHSQSSVPHLSTSLKQKETSSTTSSDSSQSKENTVGSSTTSINHTEDSAKSSPEKNKPENKSEGNSIPVSMSCNFSSS